MISHLRHVRPELVDPISLDLEASGLAPDTPDAACLVSWGLARLRRGHAAEARRRNRSAPAPFWVLRSRLHAAAAAAGLVIVSMTIGGAAVAASYQAQTNERRGLLIASYERRLDLARQRMALAQQQLQTVEGRIAVGVEKPENALEQRARIVQIEAEITSLELQIAEVRITGLEPREEVSAPLADGNDFLGKRWEAEIRVPESELELASTQLRGIDRRMAVGLANPSDAAEARARGCALGGSPRAGRARG